MSRFFQFIKCGFFISAIFLAMPAYATTCAPSLPLAEAYIQAEIIIHGKALARRDETKFTFEVIESLKQPDDFFFEKQIDLLSAPGGISQKDGSIIHNLGIATDYKGGKEYLIYGQIRSDDGKNHYIVPGGWCSRSGLTIAEKIDILRSAPTKNGHDMYLDPGPSSIAFVGRAIAAAHGVVNKKTLSQITFRIEDKIHVGNQTEQSFASAKTVQVLAHGCGEAFRLGESYLILTGSHVLKKRISETGKFFEGYFIACFSKDVNPIRELEILRNFKK